MRIKCLVILIDRGGVYSKPRPFENRKGSGTRKGKTSSSVLTYWNGIIPKRGFVNGKMGKGWPPAVGRKRNLVRVIRACSLIAGGLILNYILKHFSFGHWPDALIPTLVVVLVTTGVVQVTCEATGFEGSCLLLSLFLSGGLGLAYASISLSFQTFEMGTRLVEDCPGLISAAASPGEVPQSQSSLPEVDPAAYCMAARVGALLEPYAYLEVYGVTSRAAENRILSKISAYRDANHRQPVRVEFYEKENWIMWKNDKTGASGGMRGPERLIRVATLD
jgi:hypothetical protein